MRYYFALVGLVLGGFLAACEDQGSQPSPPIGVTINYYEGFHGDSVIVWFDGKILGSSLGYSDSLNVPSGWALHTYAGLHRLRLEIPVEGTSADTIFRSMPGAQTWIDATFDRGKKTISYEIYSWPLH